MAKYVCGKCKFGFFRTGEVETCPACGSMSVSFVNTNTGEDARVVAPRIKPKLHRRGELRSPA